ncbi:hypothetical protein HY570_00590 [Candidatus Micrarchaeota archaeon]|nr:hypothetical protein [Candidatus Micrarchaeota archaeon]
MVEQVGIIRRVAATVQVKTGELWDLITKAREDRRQYETANAALKLVYDSAVRKLQQA